MISRRYKIRDTLLGNASQWRDKIGEADLAAFVASLYARTLAGSAAGGPNFGNYLYKFITSTSLNYALQELKTLQKGSYDYNTKAMNFRYGVLLLAMRHKGIQILVFPASDTCYDEKTGRWVC